MARTPLAAFFNIPSMSFSCTRLLGTHLGCARSITGITHFFQKGLKGLLLASGLFLCGVSLAACTHQGRYMETHEISHLKVIFIDDQSLQDLWKAKTGKSSTQFQPWLQGNLAAVKTVRGFYDFATETLYCPKWNYEVCGHELHHAALGHFHPNH